jgi:predicted  nucleic acid-binding Zn-ribbon protein
MKTIEQIQLEVRIEQLSIDLNNLNDRHDAWVSMLKKINTEIQLLEDEQREELVKLRKELENASPFESAEAMARLLGIVE